MSLSTESLIAPLARPSCGRVATQGDSIEKLAFIALRYRALIGEAIAFPYIHGERLHPRVVQMLHGCLDSIEHDADDLYFSTSAMQMAAGLMDEISVMKHYLTAERELLGDRLVPSVEDLRSLYVALWSFGGRPHSRAPAFDMTGASASSVTVQQQAAGEAPIRKSIYEHLGASPERDLFVTALQALHRERTSAWNSQTAWASQSGQASLDQATFGVNEVAVALRHLGAASSPR